MKKKVLLALFSIGAICFVGFLPFRYVSGDGEKPGVHRVPLNSNDPKPRTSIENDTAWDANDLEFELVGGSGVLDPDKTFLADSQGNDLGWSKPTKKGSKWEMKMNPEGSPIPAHGWRGLALESKNNKGWSMLRYSLTENGNSIYPTFAVVENYPEHVFTTTFQTGNGVPLTLGVVTGFQNNGPGSISELRLSVTTEQQFEEFESDFNGYPVYGDHAVAWVFDPPVDPGNLVKISWKYDRFGPGDSTDVEATFLITYLVFGDGETKGDSASKPRILDPSVGVVTIPRFYVRETKIGGLKKGLVFSSGGAFKFVKGSGIARTVKGSETLGAFSVTENGDTLKADVHGESKELCVVEITGLKIDISKAPAGVIRLYLHSGKAKVGKVLGKVTKKK